jgi:hypothetical protein
MSYHEDLHDYSIILEYGPMSRESPTPDQHARRPLARLVAWLWQRLDDGMSDAETSRVFYQFDSGSWRCRSTRQLSKVYRCR